MWTVFLTGEASFDISKWKILKKIILANVIRAREAPFGQAEAEAAEAHTHHTHKKSLRITIFSY